jgi:sugar phosphate isomerase/epimerase
MLRGAAGVAAFGAAVALPGTAGADVPSSRPRLRIPREQVSIQLYSLRSLLEKDVPGTLSALADIGYQRVELAGLYGYSATQFKAELDKVHITANSSHVGLDGNVNQVIADAKVLGNLKVVHPYANYGTIAEWQSFTAKLETAGKAIRAAGLHAGYHNHDHEFRAIGGTRPYDVITRGTTDANVHLEIDLYWAVTGGQDPVDVVFSNYGRVWQYHVKDRKPDGSMTDPGTGTIDFPAIFRHTWHEGIQDYIVEHDQPTDPLHTAKVGYDYLFNLRF